MTAVRDALPALVSVIALMSITAAVLGWTHVPHPLAPAAAVLRGAAIGQRSPDTRLMVTVDRSQGAQASGSNLNPGSHLRLRSALTWTMVQPESSGP